MAVGLTADWGACVGGARAWKRTGNQFTRNFPPISSLTHTQNESLPREGPEPGVAVDGAMGVFEPQRLDKGGGGPHLRQD